MSEVSLSIVPVSSNTQIDFGSRKITAISLTLVTAFIFTTLYNARIWQVYFNHNGVSSISEILQFFCFFLFIYALVVSLFSLFTFRWLHKVSLILFFMVSAPAVYFSASFGTLFDASMLQNALETDAKETMDLMTFQFAIIVLVLGIIPSLVIAKIDVVYSVWHKQIAKNISLIFFMIALASLAVFSFYGELSFFVRANNTVLKNSFLPSAPLNSLYKNIISSSGERHIVKEIVDKNARIVALANPEQVKPLKLVVILGETAREKSFSLNDTGLSQQTENLINRDNLFYFSNFWSCGTNTALSVPCMFSTYGKDDYKRDMNRKYENVAEIAARVGYDLVWRNNNSGCKGICTRLNNDPIDLENSAEFAHDSEFYDEALVQDLGSRVTKTNEDQIIFLHQLGSHGPAYYKRVPQSHKVLQPACESEDFAQCEPQEIVNAYNNTILYTKHIINQAIDQLDAVSEDFDTLLIYVSDHGESTGENGLYLHGIPYFMAPDEQTHIPALVWMSDEFMKNRSINGNCLAEKVAERYSHDNFSHTLLGLLNIDTKVYSPSLDLLQACRGQVAL